MGQLSDEELCCIVRRRGHVFPQGHPRHSRCFRRRHRRPAPYGIPVGCCADGPSGIRMDCGTIAFSMPNGTCLACSFNLELVRELYVRARAAQNKVDTLLGPGINLHRHPPERAKLRIFSEDPLLTGKMAAAQLQGMHPYGVRHHQAFCLQQSEFRRNDVEAVVSERYTLRNSYLKGFELAVKEGGAYSVSDSYNPVNGFWSASNYDLLTTVLRGQWGYQGIVMTDWWAKSNDEGKPGERTNTSAMVRGQNDLFMVVENAQQNSMQDNSAEGLRSGAVSRAEFQRSAAGLPGWCACPRFSACAGSKQNWTASWLKAQGWRRMVSARCTTCRQETAPSWTSPVINTEKGRNITQFSVSLQERGLYTHSPHSPAAARQPLSGFPSLSLRQKASGYDHTLLTGGRDPVENRDAPIWSPAFSGRCFLSTALLLPKAGLSWVLRTGNDPVPGRADSGPHAVKSPFVPKQNRKTSFAKPKARRKCAGLFCRVEGPPKRQLFERCSKELLRPAPISR